MPSIINASSSGSGGIVQTADASGVLQLQSNGSVGFTVGSTAVASGSSSATVGPFTNNSLGTFNGFLQVGANLQLMSFSNGTTNTQTQLASNTYYSGAYRAIAGGAGASKLFLGGGGTFEFAGSNTLTNAGDIITFVPTLACGALGQSIALQGASPAVGTGITFPTTQNASTNANTLDDYEEGTYTANMTPTSGSISMAGAENTGYYVKIGRMVMVTGRITAASVSSPSGELGINLPFTIANITQQATAPAGSIFVWNAAAGASQTGLWTLFSDIGQSSIFARWGNSTTPGGGAGFIQANTEIRFTVTYVAAS